MSVTDLIRRSDAIDANCEDWCGCKYKDCQHEFEENEYCDGCDTVGVLKKLPPAQPEKSTTEEKSQLAEEKSTRKLIYLDDAIDEIEILLEQSEDDEHDKTWNDA